MLADEFGQLVEQYQPALMRLAYGMAGDRLVAEDAVQACWQAAWRFRDEIDPARFRGWLFTVTANQVRRHLRKQRLGNLVRGLIQPSGEPVEQHPSYLDLAETLRRLDLRDRQLIALRYGLGLTSEEIGEQLGLSPSGVRVRLHRVLAMLRKELGDD